jgi:hypothetical protein
VDLIQPGEGELTEAVKQLLEETAAGLSGPVAPGQPGIDVLFRPGKFWNGGRLLLTKLVARVKGLMG